MNRNTASVILKAFFLIILSSHISGISAEPVDRGLTGKKICREAQGPDDTASFEIVLLENGTISGSGSWNGASASMILSSGSWRRKGSSVEIILNYTGKTFGPGGHSEGVKRFVITVPAYAVKTSGRKCFIYTGGM